VADTSARGFFLCLVTCTGSSLLGFESVTKRRARSWHERVALLLSSALGTHRRTCTPPALTIGIISPSNTLARLLESPDVLLVDPATDPLLSCSLFARPCACPLPIAHGCHSTTETTDAAARSRAAPIRLHCLCSLCRMVCVPIRKLALWLAETWCGTHKPQINLAHRYR